VHLYKKRKKEKTAIEKKGREKKEVHNNRRAQERLFQHAVMRRLAAGAESPELGRRPDTVSCIAFPPACSTLFLLRTCDQHRCDMFSTLFNFALLFELF
jgi:hypothetical protein